MENVVMSNEEKLSERTSVLAVAYGIEAEKEKIMADPKAVGMSEELVDWTAQLTAKFNRKQ